MTGGKQLELLILTADKNTQFALEGLLGRWRELGIRPIESWRVIPHPRRDPAVLRESHHFLRPFLHQAKYCLVVFDREGSGGRTRSREELEKEVQDRLDANGWEKRSSVVVIDPELEAWVWADSPEVGAILGLTPRGQDLNRWMLDRGWRSRPGAKPDRPKEAMEAALFESRTPRSSAIYKMLAERIPFRRCTDPAFEKLRHTLRAWFPAA
jgi:hypothetical protein